MRQITLDGRSLGFSRWIGVRDGPRTGPFGAAEVPGLHVAGDLGAAPVLKAAFQDGWNVGTHLAGVLPGTPPTSGFDVVIVGAGPAGCAAAAALHGAGRRVLVVDRDRPFHTVDAFPRGKMIYAEPRGVQTDDPFEFEDAPKEVLVRRWREQARELGLDIRTRTEVTDIKGADGAFTITTESTARDGSPPQQLRARKVIVAVGRRGTPRWLGVPGESGSRVSHGLADPAAWTGKEVLVVGGGDSAVEAAVALARADARTRLSYRGKQFTRPKPHNLDALESARAAGSLEVDAPSEVVSFHEGGAVLREDSTARTVPMDQAFVLVGTDPHVGWLRRIGVRLDSDADPLRTGLGLAFVALVWCFYLLKTGRAWVPFSSGPLASVPALLTVPVPWYPTADGSIRTLGPGFWGTVVYSLTILGLGLAARRRYDGAEQKRRYLSLITFQCVFLFGIPELLAPAVTTASSALYTLTVPWPLSIWSLAHGPEMWMWLGVGAFTSFVLVPIYVRRNNESFCSYLCGCGGLAETLGDLWRWRAPRGATAKRAEGAGRLVLLLAIPVTLLILNDAWQLVGYQRWLEQDISWSLGSPRADDASAPEVEGFMRIADVSATDDGLRIEVEKFDWDGVWRPTGWIGDVLVGDTVVYPQRVEEGVYLLDVEGPQSVTVRAGSSPLSSATRFATHWYGLMVDFWLGSILGVALYPFLGNRVWCRFFCPLRAYMELLSRWFGRLAIRANDTCISCGECTRACQMGIDVQGFAEKGLHFDNANSACIQCGICVEVCPMECLTLVDKLVEGLPDGDRERVGPRW